jgi:Reverse transcriptase (RNA-dependent DNA polymerase)
LNSYDGATVEELRTGKKLPGYQEIKCHMIFDVKIDLTRKARFVAGGHTTETPASITYSSVVSRDSIRIAFLLAALNGLQILSVDIGNAYLNADCREKIWTIAGPEFGSDQGRPMLIRRALYGLKSSGAAWRAHFAQTLLTLGYKSSLADPDVWLRPQQKPDGNKYYEYVLVYVDDVLHLSHDPNPTMQAIGKAYRIKEGSLGEPKRYLGADVLKRQLADGREVWSLSARTYVNNAVKTLEAILEKEDIKLKAKPKRPTPLGYRPEVDTSEALDAELASRYQNLIGMLRWACELGRIDIMTEVSMLSSHNALPRAGHLQAVYQVFAYLKAHENSSIVFDDAIPDIDERRFRASVNWQDLYGDVTEQLPPNMPPPLGNPVKISAFVDADHAGNLITRRSHTGILIYLNKAPIIWYSKRQNTVESSTFGSEFVAMRIAVDQIEALRYKLRMFGIPLDGPADVFCDNQSVVTSSSVPESMLAKKHNAICYHRVREAVASRMIRVAKEDTHTNLADILTKLLPTEVRRHLLDRILY